MADKDKGRKADVQAPATASKKGFPFKTIIIIAAALLLEGAAIMAVFMFTSGPATVHADPAAQDAAALAEQPVEKLVIEDKFQNTRTGRAYLYDTQIYIVIKRKHENRVESLLKEKTAAINADITTIFRRAEPAHLLEPTFATLTRQIKAALDNRVGRDPETGESLVEEVLITKCNQFRSDI